MLSYAAKTDLGNQRENNEDRYLANPELGLWIMADGVGGQDAGEVASRIVCDVISARLKSGEGLESAINTAHQAVRQSPSDGIGRLGMASTVVALLMQENNFQISWVGDSRAYLWNSGELRQLSRDQSLVQRLVDEKVISPEQAINHPQRNIIIQALGQENLESVEVETVHGTLEPDDIILLCSDGLSDYVSDEEITGILQKTSNETTLVNKLVEAALKTEGKDNITAVIIHNTVKHGTLKVKVLWAVITVTIGVLAWLFLSDVLK